MDRLAEQHGGTAAVAGLPRSTSRRSPAAFGCPARSVGEHGELLEALDEVMPTPRRPRRATAPRGHDRPGRDLRPVTRAVRDAAPRRERAGRVRDPALRLCARPQSGRAPRNGAGARSRVRRQSPDAAGGAAVACRLAPDPGDAGPGRRHLRREHGERGDDPHPQRVDRGDARGRQHLAARAARRARPPRGTARRARCSERDRADSRGSAGGDRWRQRATTPPPRRSGSPTRASTA